MFTCSVAVKVRELWCAARLMSITWDLYEVRRCFSEARVCYFSHHLKCRPGLMMMFGVGCERLFGSVTVTQARGGGTGVVAHPLLQWWSAPVCLLGTVVGLPARRQIIVLLTWSKNISHIIQPCKGCGLLWMMMIHGSVFLSEFDSCSRTSVNLHCHCYLMSVVFLL